MKAAKPRIKSGATMLGRRRSDVDVLVDAFLWVLDLIVPDKNARYRRVQRLGCVLFGGFGIVVAVVVALDVFVIGGR